MVIPFHASVHENDPAKVMQIAGELREQGTLTPFVERFGNDPNYIKLVTDIARWDSPQTTVDASKINLAKIKELAYRSASGQGSGAADVPPETMRSVVQSVKEYSRSDAGKRAAQKAVQKAEKNIPKLHSAMMAKELGKELK